MNKITIIGCGPGARECVTLEAFAEIARAETVIGTDHLFALFPDTKAERIVVRGYREETIEAIQQRWGRRVALLVTGDPGLASLASAVIQHFGIDACRVLPGISSVQVAFARLGLSWEGARIISAHAATPAFDVDSLLCESKIAVLTGAAGAMPWVTSLVRKLGEKWRFVIAQDLTLQTERISDVKAEELEALPQPMRAVVVCYRKSIT
jgi:precorrin-6y C5,15-methyltransferase (decarboxylating) CbiE subunit